MIRVDSDEIVDVGVIDGIQRVSVYDSETARRSGRVARVAAAGRERESFQIALRSEENRTIRVRTPHALCDEETGNEISGDMISVHAVGYVFVGNETDSTRLFPMPCSAEALREAGGCWVADPLIPLDPSKNQTRLVSNLTVSLWVTLNVPPGQPAGKNYTGRIEIEIEGNRSAFVRMDARIFGFDIPVAATLKNAIQLDISHLYRSFQNISMDEMKRVFLRTGDWVLREFRINPGSIYDTWTNLTSSNLDAYDSPFVANVSDLTRWMEMGMNAFTIPHAAAFNRTRSFVDELRAQEGPLLSMASFYGFDEFSGPFDEITNDFVPLRTTFPEIRTLTTAHVGTQYDTSLVPNPLPFDPNSLRHIGVTAIVPQTNYLPPAQNITAVQRAGLEVWTYISLQPYKPLASWRLDNPLVDVRGLFWQIFKLGFDGILYWGLNQWSAFNTGIPIPSILAKDNMGIFRDLPFVPIDAWDVATYHDGTLPWLFGDGKMLYAGTTSDNETSYEPIGSLRMANIRDGLDDYDYLHLLSKIDPTLALQISSRVAGSNVSSLVRNVTTLRKARVEIGAALERAGGNFIREYY